MNNKETIKELNKILQEVYKIKINFNLCLTTLENQKQDIINKINILKSKLREE